MHFLLLLHLHLYFYLHHIPHVTSLHFTPPLILNLTSYSNLEPLHLIVWISPLTQKPSSSRLRALPAKIYDCFFSLILSAYKRMSHLNILISTHRFNLLP
ncbi:uncharacterized protein F4807DRAFT_289471 [Annulohypoxylon truncatum]|uniref:uncharacterized protein n=1 Tax=Annulohypoxylon truncatum TaxID=327061 RepID=UPI002007E5E2|nr:uncharacterized protein F4807DRAFT_289471 [Annulohypoxylon truncatum]KAI1205360.1 hypothetical protein F4807DRAFT_289471 [Annulohypoxylon truncatum]